MTLTRRLDGRAGTRIPAFGASVLLAALASACGGEKPPAPRERLTVAAAMVPHTSLLHVANANGYFAGAGLDVTVQRHAFGKLALEALLAGKADLATAADTPVDMAPEEMSDALAAGRIDAVVTWNPYVVHIKRRLGDAVTVFYADDIYMETFILVGRPDLVSARTAAVEKFVRSLLQAESFCREHPEEARRLVASALAMETADIDAIWGAFDFRVRLDQGLLVLLDDEARWAIRSRLAPNQPTPNFLDAIAFRPLENAKPDAVRLIR